MLDSSRSLRGTMKARTRGEGTVDPSGPGESPLAPLGALQETPSHGAPGQPDHVQAEQHRQRDADPDRCREQGAGGIGEQRLDRTPEACEKLGHGGRLST